jgi:hypothetical protein
MSWEQKILNASVSVNRSVWALNIREFSDFSKSSFKSKADRNSYVSIEVRKAIKELRLALTELEGEIDFEDSEE